MEQGNRLGSPSAELPAWWEFKQLLAACPQCKALPAVSCSPGLLTGRGQNCVRHNTSSRRDAAFRWSLKISVAPVSYSQIRSERREGERRISREGVLQRSRPVSHRIACCLCRNPSPQTASVPSEGLPNVLPVSNACDDVQNRNGFAFIPQPYVVN